MQHPASLAVRRAAVKFDEQSGVTWLSFDCGEGRRCCIALTPKRADWLLGAFEAWWQSAPDIKPDMREALFSHENSLGLVDRIDFWGIEEGTAIIIALHAAQSGNALIVSLQAPLAAGLLEHLRGALPLWSAWALKKAGQSAPH